MKRSKARRTISKNGIIHSYRKVVKTGGSLFISLPAQWVRENGIKAGDEFAMTANSMVSMVKNNHGSESGA